MLHDFVLVEKGEQKDGSALLVFHGFPTSSYDFTKVGAESNCKYIFKNLMSDVAMCVHINKALLLRELYSVFKIFFVLETPNIENV